MSSPFTQIAVFGGSFNPPTRAHEAIIRACLALPQFKQVWAMPSGDRDDKQIVGASNLHRLAMLKLIKKEVFGSDPRLAISDFELNLPLPTKTHRTVQALKAAYPDYDFWFVFGPDSLRDMPNWEHGHELAHGLPIVLITGDSPISVRRKNILRLPLPPQFNNTSSTAARRAIASGAPDSGMVSPAIRQYIATNKLY